MTTPNDAAQPVAKIRVGGGPDPSTVMWITDSPPTTPILVYTATDYDKLREYAKELERTSSEVIGQNAELVARAEAAEATLDDFIEAAEHYFNTGTADALRAVLNDQINAQGESNGN